MKNKLFISCEEASHQIDKAQYGEASFWEKFTYRLHVLYCKLCRVYLAKSKKLSELLRTEKVNALTPEQKLKIKEKLKESAATS